MRTPKLSKTGDAFLSEIKKLKFDDYEAGKLLAKIFLNQENGLATRRREFMEFRMKYEHLYNDYKKLLRKIIDFYSDKIPQECRRSDGKLKNNWFNCVKNQELFYLIKMLRKTKDINLDFTSFLFAITLQMK